MTRQRPPPPKKKKKRKKTKKMEKVGVGVQLSALFFNYIGTFKLGERRFECGVLPIKIRDYTYLLVHSLHTYIEFFSKIKNHCYIIVKTRVKFFMDEIFLIII